MTAYALLRAIVAALESSGHPTELGFGRMHLVRGVPVLREQGGRVVLLGTKSRRARTVGADEEPAVVAAEILTRIA